MVHAHTIILEGKLWGFNHRAPRQCPNTHRHCDRRSPHCAPPLRGRAGPSVKWRHLPDMVNHFRLRYPSLDRLTLTQAPTAAHAVVVPPLACVRTTAWWLGGLSRLGSRPTGWGYAQDTRATSAPSSAPCEASGSSWAISCSWPAVASTRPLNITCNPDHISSPNSIRSTSAPTVISNRDIKGYF